MKKIIVGFTITLLTLSFSSCSNEKNSENEGDDIGASTTSFPDTSIMTTSIDTPVSSRIEATSISSTVETSRTTPKLLKSQVWIYDSKVADVSSTLRELKESIEKGAKVTPKMDKNITAMIDNAKKLREPILNRTGEMAERELNMFERDRTWIDELETEFEGLKQTAAPGN